MTAAAVGAATISTAADNWSATLASSRLAAVDVGPTGVSARLQAGPVAVLTPLVDLNPLHWLGDKAKESLADGFASMMMGLWSAGVWLMRTAFSLIDSFTPNVNDPDLAGLYAVTLWVALAIALVVALAQVGAAVLRQDGRGFGILAAGVVQYGVVVACWVGVCAGVIAGTSGLSDAILQTLLGVDSFSGYAAGDGFVDTVSGTVQAATLGVCALFLVIPAAFGHLIIMLVRSAALLILTATMPIAAAGALSEGTKSWMWKSIRWFLACALMQPLLALVLGLGTQFAWSGMPDGDAGATGAAGAAGAESAGRLGSGLGGVHAHLAASSTAQNIGLSVVGSVILLVSCFTPLVLFRLLAFVDPGTASGASFRSTMSANGGVSGLLRGDRHRAGATGAGAGSGAASETSPDGRTSAENGADAQTANRWQAAAAAGAGGGGDRRPGGSIGGKVGGLVGGAMQTTGRVAQLGASMAVDVLGQSGIGNQSYYDLSRSPEQARSRHHQAHRMQPTLGEHDTHSDHEPTDHASHASHGGHGGPGGAGHQHGPAPSGGVANDLPPQAQAAAEDGVFFV